MRFFLFFVVFFISNFILNANNIKLSEVDNRFVVSENSILGFKIVNFLSEFAILDVNHDSLDFVNLFVSGYGYNSVNGDAKLPVIEELISVPTGANILYETTNLEERIISLNDYGINKLIAPSQPSLSKKNKSDYIPFIYNDDYYNFNGFHYVDNVLIKELGIMRGQKLAHLTISPFKYNPVTNQLKIITKIEVKIIFDNLDKNKYKLAKEKYYSPEFEHLFKSCINYIPTYNNDDIITTYPVKYIIISDPLFQSVLQPLIEWKTKKGFNIIEGYTDDPAVGNTTVSIYNFIKSFYDNATANDPPPTYLLIVGDINLVPSFSGNTGNHISDMYYCEFDGNGDFYPEMYYGRFSGENISQIEAQVSKTLMYEKYTFPNPDFLDDVLLVAGVDANMAPVHGNGQINYATDNYFNSTHGLSINSYLYGSGTPITSDMSIASNSIISNVSEGVGFANYTAHCGSSGWSDPSFSNADIPFLNNDNQFGVMIGNCCQSNAFDVSVCFGEALLRENNKGAVGYIGGSNNTYWDEDYWWAVGNTSNITSNPNYISTGLGVYDCLMHENGEQEQDWFITQGQFIHSGNLAVTQAGGAEEYYWEIYHLMGDPSLMPYIGVPNNLIVNHQPIIPLGSSTFTVNTEENAYVALSMNGVLLDAKMADVSGIVNLTFPSITSVGIVDIVITKQFKIPYINSVPVISPSGPYVICPNFNINDAIGNNNLIVDYSEIINLSLDLHNVGSNSASNLTVTISSNDTNITIINSNTIVQSINQSQIISTPFVFSFKVDDYIIDQHIVEFGVDISDNLGNSWLSYFNVVLNAPIIESNTLIVNDNILGNSNGKLDPGEVTDINIDVFNSGHSDLDNITATLNSNSSYVNFNTNINHLTLLLNSNQTLNFNLEIDANTPPGTFVSFNLEVSDGTYTYYKIYTNLIGDIGEDYESGNFNQYSWNQGLYPWIIDSSMSHEGVFSTRSAIGLPDDEESELSITLDIVAPGNISFWKFVSSELNEDELKFKINGDKLGEWSGEDVAWSYISYPVNIGQNTFKWEYDKNSQNSQGMDCAWIDYIIFPPLDLGQLSNISNIEQQFNIFPNPSVGRFNIYFNDNKRHSIKIYDTKGKLIECFDNQKQMSVFDLRDKPSGTYILKVFPESISYKIVKN